MSSSSQVAQNINRFGPKALLLTLTTGHLVNDFYGLVLPFLLPALITNFQLNYAQAGVLALATTVLSGILQPLLGYLADKYGLRKRIIVAGFFAFCVGFTVMSVSAGYALVLAACLVIGLGESTFHPQSTNFLTHTFPRAKGRVMGIHGLGGSIGNFSAPLAVAFLISTFGWRFGVQLLIIPSILVIGLLTLALSEPKRNEDATLRGGLTMPLVLLALNFGLILMMYKGFLTFLPTFLVESGQTITQAGGISSLMLLVGLLAQPAGGYLYDKWGGKFVFSVCALGAGLALFLFTLSSGPVLILWIICVGAFSTALFPVALAMASEISNPGQVGLSVGLVFGISGSLSAMTPLFTGYTADQLGLNQAFRLLVILAILALVIAQLLPPRKTTQIGGAQ